MQITSQFRKTARSPGFRRDVAAGVRRRLPGIVLALAAVGCAWAIHSLIPAIPLLTAAVGLGIVVAQIPRADRSLTGPLAPGLRFSARTLMRLGVALLGLKLSLITIAQLGWLSIGAVIAVLALTFVVTLALGILFRLPGHQPVLIAAGFSICGASAIGAMSSAVDADDEETATPIALVTLCGTLAIIVLPVLWYPLGLDAVDFGRWVGASVHDVGQVVATAQVAGSAALAIAVLVKLTRVMMLAPMVSIAALVSRRRNRIRADGTSRTPIIPLFVTAFIVAALIRTFFHVPPEILDIVDALQTLVLGMALFGLGTAVKLRQLVTTGWLALIVSLISWATIATLAYWAVMIA